MKHRHTRLNLLLILGLVLSTALFAAETAPSPLPDAGKYTQLVMVLTPFIALLGTFVANQLLPKLPNYLVPVVASAIGVLPDLINHFASGAPSNTITAMLLGLAATGLHQIKVQWQQRPAATDPSGASGPTGVTG